VGSITNNKAKPAPEGLGSICPEWSGPIPLTDFVLLELRFLQKCQASVQKSGVPMQVPLSDSYSMKSYSTSYR
jgi:hypothetical protein